MLCPCGSGKYKQPLCDARGIFVAYVCSKCRRRKKSEFRPEIFENASYEADEPIEPEE
jgi:hypothetical protein